VPFYLIVNRRYETHAEWVALPVTGECELIRAEITAASESDAPHVAGWISHDGEVIEVLDLKELTSEQQVLPPPQTPLLVEAFL
jgi:hypothetical protein